MYILYILIKFLRLFVDSKKTNFIKYKYKFNNCK